MDPIYNLPEAEVEKFDLVWRAWKIHPVINRSFPFDVHSNLPFNSSTPQEIKKMKWQEFEKITNRMMDFGLFELREDNDGWKRGSWASVGAFIEDQRKRDKEEERKLKAIEDEIELRKRELEASEIEDGSGREILVRLTQILEEMLGSNKKLSDAYSQSQSAMREMAKIMAKQIENEGGINTNASDLIDMKKNPPTWKKRNDNWKTLGSIGGLAISILSLTVSFLLIKPSLPQEDQQSGQAEEKTEKVEKNTEEVTPSIGLDIVTEPNVEAPDSDTTKKSP